MRLAALLGALAMTLGAAAQPALYQQAVDLEKAGKGADAVRLRVAEVARLARSASA